ncbi:MAG: hypothetical protein HEQ17_10510 [Limnohabitans sp.]|jgi:hypothetical protein|uniref:hypothetical protein n=2 Tax=Limnohabitans sp. TaxID=1907725 RepID=UPI0025E14838|nr:hypothetical protein [Limnohabitans sp.]MCO4089343.1 hypothetical protein [Limnohabitans sp.]
MVVATPPRLMLKQLIKLLVLSPGLLREHAQGYAALASQAWQQHLRVLQLRWALYALALVCGLLALGLGSVSCLLWAALPALSERHVLVLWALPLVWLAGGLLCFTWARSLRLPPLLDQLQAQVKLDVQALRTAQVA